MCFVSCVHVLFMVLFIMNVLWTVDESFPFYFRFVLSEGKYHLWHKWLTALFMNHYNFQTFFILSPVVLFLWTIPSSFLCKTQTQCVARSIFPGFCLYMWAFPTAFQVRLHRLAKKILISWSSDISDVALCYCDGTWKIVQKICGHKQTKNVKWFSRCHIFTVFGHSRQIIFFFHGHHKWDRIAGAFRWKT